MKGGVGGVEISYQSMPRTFTGYIQLVKFDLLLNGYPEKLVELWVVLDQTG